MNTTSQPIKSPGPTPLPSPGLHTDRYELTMLSGALRSKIADRHAVFELYARSLPNSRRYGIVAGTGRLLEQISNFFFPPDEIDWLLANQVIDPRTADWLSTYRFHGDVDGYAEGEVYVPGSPILRVEGTFAESLILETLVLSVMNFDSAVASTAARMVQAARGRPLIEMGSRRTHEESAIAAARAAYIAGFAATSNLAAGWRYQVPTTGTSAHAFILAHDDELAAFAAQVAALGNDTTLLVDTYNTYQGIQNAITVAGPTLDSIRIDSGDLAAEAFRARTQLDSLAAPHTHITLTGDLDEYRITEILDQNTPVDAFGVGTRLVAGASCPSPGFVYKLVAIADSASTLRAVAKTCGEKSTKGGRKYPRRHYGNSSNIATQEIIESDLSFTPDPNLTLSPTGDRYLQIPLIRVGEVVYAGNITQARARCADSLAELSPEAHSLDPGVPCLITTYPPIQTIQSKAEELS